MPSLLSLSLSALSLIRPTATERELQHSRQLGIAEERATERRDIITPHLHLQTRFTCKIQLYRTTSSCPPVCLSIHLFVYLYVYLVLFLIFMFVCLFFLKFQSIYLVHLFPQIYSHFSLHPFHFYPGFSLYFSSVSLSFFIIFIFFFFPFLYLNLNC